MSKILLPLATFCAFAIAPLASRADIPPPDGYVEKCTVAAQEKPNELCASYKGSYSDAWGCLTDKANTPTDPSKCSSSGDQADCCDAWLAAGWTYRCKTYGASFFTVIWCRPRQPTDPPRPDGKVATADGKAASADAKAVTADGKPVTGPGDSPPREKSDGCAISRGSAPAGAVAGLGLLVLALVGLRLGRRFRR